MRILSSHLTPLERQVQESCNILGGMLKPEEFLNRKSEWGGEQRYPDYLLNPPKVWLVRRFGKDKEIPEEEMALKLVKETIRREVRE